MPAPGAPIPTEPIPTAAVDVAIGPDEAIRPEAGDPDASAQAGDLAVGGMFEVDTVDEPGTGEAEATAETGFDNDLFLDEGGHIELLGIDVQDFYRLDMTDLIIETMADRMGNPLSPVQLLAISDIASRRPYEFASRAHALVQSFTEARAGDVQGDFEHRDLFMKTFHGKVTEGRNPEEVRFYPEELVWLRDAVANEEFDSADDLALAEQILNAYETVAQHAIMQHTRNEIEKYAMDNTHTLTDIVTIASLDESNPKAMMIEALKLKRINLNSGLAKVENKIKDYQG